jgi:hypothetical protein
MSHLALAIWLAAMCIQRAFSGVEVDPTSCSRFAELRVVSPEPVENTLLQESALRLEVAINFRDCGGDSSWASLAAENFQVHVNEAEWLSVRLEECVHPRATVSVCTLWLLYLEAGPKRVSVAMVDEVVGYETEDSVFFFADADKYAEQLNERNPWMAAFELPQQPQASAVLENVALHKPTMQQSTALGKESGLAVDGNTDCDFQAGSCSHTGSSDGLAGTLDPWWTVDLLDVYHIHHIRILNRGSIHPLAAFGIML